MEKVGGRVVNEGSSADLHVPVWDKGVSSLNEGIMESPSDFHSLMGEAGKSSVICCRLW